MLKLAKTSTFTRNVNVQLPTDKPNDFNTGTLAVRYKLKSKAEYLDLFDKGLSDVEFFDQVVDGVDGLGDAGGQAISGEPALNECRSGPWSNHLLHAIVSDYVDQWSDARVKNSRPSRGR